MKNRMVIVGGLSLLFIGWELIGTAPLFAASQTSEREMGIISGATGCACDNCHSVLADFYECEHLTETDTCQSEMCIDNHLDTGTCDPDAEEADCNTELSGGGFYWGLVQYVRHTTNCVASWTGNFHEWTTVYYSNNGGNSCIGRIAWVRCDTTSCSGELDHTNYIWDAIICK